MTDDARKGASRLDAYLDGALDDAEREAFERACGRDDLPRRAAQQGSIDHALTSLYAPPTAQCIERWCKAVSPTVSVSSPRRRRFSWVPQPVLAAACLAITALGVWRIWGFIHPRPGVNAYAPQAWRSMAQVYHDEVVAGFTPKMVCRDNDRFAAFVAHRFGHPLLLSALPAGVEALGWSYSNTISPRSTQILCRADGAPLLVFVDRAEVDNVKAARPTNELNVFRRELGPLVLYEVTPLPESAFLDRFYQPPSTP